MRNASILTVLLALGIAFLVSAGSDAMVAPGAGVQSTFAAPAVAETVALRKSGSVEPDVPSSDIEASPSGPGTSPCGTEPWPRQRGTSRLSIEASRPAKPVSQPASAALWPSEPRWS